ncbi:hypothetical protein ACIQ9J_33995 [Streptomyces sp. NPDC094153]|uniref:hypothetical protein n=1 Tax=Streptomyces sp. NPDC094153 TaxID=3366058 RepID=UPI003820F16C
MQINGAEQQQRGHVLLLAGDIAARRRNVQVVPSANLAALSVVPVPVLLGSDVPSDTTYLDGIHDQNALQVRLRAAAATPGPLLVYLSGRLTTDRRGQSLYLALPGTTAATARYAALPWEWLGIELRTRPPGLTTVLFDLAADKTAWPLLQEYGTLPAATNAEVFGVIAPPGFSGTETGVSTYTRAWIEQLRRNPDRPTNSRLHALTVGTAALPPGALVIPFAPQINAAPSHEPAARPPKSNLQRLLAGDTSVLPGRRRAEEPAEVAPGLDRMPTPPAPQYEYPAPVPTPQYQAPAPQPQHYATPGPVPSAPQRQQPAPEFPAPAPRPQAPAQSPSAPGYAEPGPGPVPAHQQRPEPLQQPVRAPHPTPAPPPPAPQTYVPHQAPAPAPQPAPVQPPVPAQPDPRPHIHALSEAGQHREAARLAQAWEQHTLHTHGIDSPQATQWVEIRADLAKREGNYQLATQLWIAAGRTRLAHQSPDAPEVLAAATSAHHCWTQMPDPGQARECGPELISLLRALPALDRRHLSMAQQRLEFLHNTPTGR